MPIQLEISPRLIPNIANLYNDTNRIFMEYIDNSIDSAEDYFDGNSYSRKIEITLRIGRNEVTIEDNSTGINDLGKIVQSLGNSDKKAQFTANGQFGYGVYSFMAACTEINVTSKVKTEQYAKKITIDRKKFETDKQGDVNFDVVVTEDFKYESGTKISLSGFDKTMWKQIDLNEIKIEIENHFELLLKRENLAIMLVSDDKEYLCESYDYDSIKGEEYIKSVTELIFLKGRKVSQEIILRPPTPINIFLKITKGVTLNRPPVFICKGRRITTIGETKKFKTTHRSDIWKHPNITGYIDLSDFLTPTISRTEFANNDNSTALFNTLIQFEPEILRLIRDVNKESDAKHYSVLEDKLNSILSKLAKIDSMNYRTEYLSGNSVNLEKGGEGQSFEDGFGGKNRGDDKNINNTGKGIGENEGDGVGPSGESGDDTSGNPKNEGDFSSNKEAENPFDDTGFKGGEKKKSGFNIRIVDMEPPVDEKDNILRSQLIGSDIRVFSEHPDFKNRVDYLRSGESKISQRLITYLAGEITVHYKDKFQTKTGQPEYNIGLFKDLVDFIYKFEDMLKELSGKNLSDLGS